MKWKIPNASGKMTLLVNLFSANKGLFPFIMLLIAISTSLSVIIVRKNKSIKWKITRKTVTS
jgi:hypothetical protein